MFLSFFNTYVKDQVLQLVFREQSIILVLIMYLKGRKSEN